MNYDRVVFFEKRGTGYQGSCKKLKPLLKVSSRTTFDFQGPSTMDLISQIVQKCTFPVHSKSTLRLKLFAPSTSLYFSVHWSEIIDNNILHKKKALCKPPLTSLSYDSYSGSWTTKRHWKKLKKIQGLAQRFNDFSRKKWNSRTLPKIQAVFKTGRTLKFPFL